MRSIERMQQPKNKNCKIHKNKEKKLQQKSTKTTSQRKEYKCLRRRERFILCYKMCYMEGKWCAIVGESQNKCERESENDVKTKLNNEIDETKIEQQKTSSKSNWWNKKIVSNIFKAFKNLWKTTGQNFQPSKKPHYVKWIQQNKVKWRKTIVG